MHGQATAPQQGGLTLATVLSPVRRLQQEASSNLNPFSLMWPPSRDLNQWATVGVTDSYPTEIRACTSNCIDSFVGLTEHPEITEVR